MVLGSDQHIASVGDFNNDGKADILWRSDNGGVSIWQSTGDAFTPVSYSTSATTDWHVVSHSYVL